MSCGQGLKGVVKNETSRLREEIKEIKQAIRALEKEKKKLADCTAELDQKLTAQTNITTRLSDEKTELERVLKNTQKQPKHSIVPWVVVAVLLMFLVTFGIKSCKSSAQNQNLKNQVTAIEDKLKPLQTEHDFTQQTYKAIVDKAYFYDDNFNRKDAYLYYGNEVITIRIKGNFGYSIYTNNKGVTLSGWLRLSDLRIIEVK
jgi:predicted nuclease with TOPRIM domain